MQVIGGYAINAITVTPTPEPNYLQNTDERDLANTDNKNLENTA